MNRQLPWMLLILLSFSCNQKPDSKELVTKPAPDAFTEPGEISSLSRRYSGNVVDKLYNEQVSKIPALKQFEDDLITYGESKEIPFNEYATYKSNIESYYGSARLMMESITDSVLSGRIIAILDNSEKEYLKLSSGVNRMQTKIKEKDTLLQDIRTALKIIRTIPVIEVYEKNYLPAQAPFNDIIKEQEILIKQSNDLIIK